MIIMKTIIYDLTITIVAVIEINDCKLIYFKICSCSQSIKPEKNVFHCFSTVHVGSYLY